MTGPGHDPRHGPHLRPGADPGSGAFAVDSSEHNQQRLASFPAYVDAQRLVDRMSDDGFPVEHVRIIGDDVRTVEQVTGRMTKPRAALYGAGSGAWWGLLVGLIISLFVVPAVGWLWLIIAAVLIGAVWGAAFGSAAHWTTRGQRDFSSVQGLRAQRYDVYVDAMHAADAARYAPQG